LLGGMELFDPRARAQRPRITAGCFPLPGCLARPPHDAVGPPVDVREREGDGPTVAHDFDKASIGKRVEEQRNPPVVGDPLVDERAAAAGAAHRRERPTQA